MKSSATRGFRRGGESEFWDERDIARWFASRARAAGIAHDEVVESRYYRKTPFRMKLVVEHAPAWALDGVWVLADGSLQPQFEGGHLGGAGLMRMAALLGLVDAEGAGIGRSAGD